MVKQVTAKEVEKRINGGEQIDIIDVREHSEIAEGKIPGAKHIPLGEIPLRKNELDKEKSYVVVCRSGNRSKAACGILNAFGFKVENMTGGMNDWQGKME